MRRVNYRRRCYLHRHQARLYGEVQPRDREHAEEESSPSRSLCSLRRQTSQCSTLPARV
jgi:hypothetical protein